MQRYKTNIKCNGCIQTVRPYLEGMKEITSWEVDLISPDRILTIEGEISEEKVIRAIRAAGYKAEKIS